MVDAVLCMGVAILSKFIGVTNWGVQRMRKVICFVLMVAIISTWVVTVPSEAARIKDLVNVNGVRANKMIGFGLVIGLANTGDQATNVFFSIQTMVNLLQKLGVTVPQDRVNQLQFKNAATVMVTSELPAFARHGDRIDVVVSSMCDSRSLQGGTLLMTPLKGADSITYAVAQGPVSIGGFSIQGQAQDIQKNHPNVGRVAGGAIVEKELPDFFNSRKEISLSLKTTDFTTGSRVAKAINFKMKDVFAEPIDGRTIRVKVPKFYINNVSGFVTKIETLEVEPDSVAKVIIDERTGTVVMGENVRISTVAVAHGNLFVQITETPEVAQPAPLSRGQTAVVPRTNITVEEQDERLVIVPNGVGIGEVVTALNAIGVTPRDLIAILQAIKASGSLHAELEIM